MKTVIGILANVDEKEFLPNSYMYQYSLNSSYVDAIKKAGGIPIILPIAKDEDIAKDYISLIDGLLLVGGRDVNPKLYNEKLIENTTPVVVEKDKSDIFYIKEMIKKEKPIFGICRGMQVLNVALGGSLYQDLRLCQENKSDHFHLEKPFDEVHIVNVKEKSLLSDLIGDNVKVNSIHHQSVKDVGENLKISARAEDGTIEAIENCDLSILGVQWHPELLLKGGKDEMLKLFEAFVEKAKEKKKI